MEPLAGPTQEVDALADRRAFADLSAFRKVRVTGSDATGWLHDLVTCDVASLPLGGSRPSLLLSPTGRIRATFAVGRDARGYVLLQAPDEPDRVEDTLRPYVLTSDVALDGAPSDELGLIAIADPAASVVEGSLLAPSVLGEGVDVLTPDPDGLRAALVARGVVEAGLAAVETWRVLRGRPRFGVDFGPESLPAEAGLDGWVDLTKGCFLGQEAVARVRNLGHPPRVLRHLRTQGRATPGTPVLSADAPAGTVTSAAAHDGGTVVIARVRWEFAQADLRLAGGGPLVPIGSMG